MKVEQRPEEELAIPGVRPPSEIAADQVGVHGLELIRRDHPPTQDPGPEAGGETFDPRIDPIAKLLGGPGPAPGNGGRHAGVRPRGVKRPCGARVGSTRLCCPMTR